MTRQRRPFGGLAARAALATMLLAAVLPAAVLAQAGGPSVVLGGRMGDKALLVIDGSPRALAVGSAAQGVRLIGLDGDSALVEVDGQRRRLQLGATQVNLGGAPSPGSGSRVVLPIGSGGHFTSAGSINGRPVLFMVDTGASTVALSQGEADRIGVRYKDSPRGMVHTANGAVPAYSVRLASIRIGEVQVYDVEAVVMPASMGMVLLGNSFLSRFDLRRDNGTMTLDKRR